MKQETIEKEIKQFENYLRKMKKEELIKWITGFVVGSQQKRQI